MIRLRRAVMSDSEAVFEWRNDPAVRDHFFDSRELSFAEHTRWFEESLRRADRVVLIAHHEQDAVGVIRFDLTPQDPTTAEVDIYLDPKMHGRGLGTAVLKEGVEWTRRHTEIKRLVARVRARNEASMKMFSKCGFDAQHLFFSKEIAHAEN
ncbi:MAG: GNAT family N-acetyltransferase [Thermodesulfobacteriota bacterium]